MTFPFRLTRQGGKASHGFVPAEIHGSVNDHHKSVFEYVYLHLKNAYSLDTLLYIVPEMLLVVSLTILLNESAVVLEVHGLYVALGGLSVLLAYISVCHK